MLRFSWEWCVSDCDLATESPTSVGMFCLGLPADLSAGSKALIVQGTLQSPAVETAGNTQRNRPTPVERPIGKSIR